MNIVQDDFLENVIQKDRYQVFLCACPAHIPFSFAIHPWLVVSRKGRVSRWEVTFIRRKREQSFGHLNKDLFSAFEGIEIILGLPKPHWRGRILGSIEGWEGSVAQRMAEYIEQSATTYPYKEQYSLMRPNSNTYVQWVLDKFPESGLTLPWNAFGKNLHNDS